MSDEAGPPGGVGRTQPFFYERARLAPYELTHVVMSGHHPATVRPGGLGASVAQDLRALRLAEQPAVARSAVELHRCCARVTCRALRHSSINILTAWPGRVALE
eukprot:scaffold3241_cov64-Phaeocystis_antarctica.AAC.2